LSIVDINWRPGPRGLLKFGLTVMIGFALLGLLFQFWFERQTVAFVLYAAGGALGLPALTGTVIGLPGSWLWMGIAFVLGNIVSRILLGLIYYLVFTPLGLLRRLTGADPLALRRGRADSYWVELHDDDEASRYERQF
jgi:hypothetical protein